MLSVDFKRCVKSPVFYISILLLYFCMMIGIMEDLWIPEHADDMLMLFQITTSLGIAHIAVPVFVILPCALLYAEEAKDSFFYYNLIRTTKKSYITSKIVTCVCTGMMVAAGAVILFLITCMLVGIHGIGNGLDGMYLDTYFQRYIETGKSYVPFLAHLITYVIFAGAWPLISLIVSTYTASKYVITAAPFFVERIVSYLTEIINISIIMPQLTLLKGPVLYLPYGGIPHAFCLNGILIGILSMVFVMRMKRKFRDG